MISILLQPLTNTQIDFFLNLSLFLMKYNFVLVSCVVRVWEDLYHVGDGQRTGYLRPNAQRSVPRHRGNQ